LREFGEGFNKMIKLIRGFRDILPEQTGLWHYVEAMARQSFEDFGFAELRIPILEKTELFARSIGANTDIVEKEMYTFSDRKGELLTLRPEATASVVRAYVEHKLYASDPVRKLFTIGPMFRRERPQKGRYRQFYQINAEVFGLHDPRADAELLLCLTGFLNRLGLSDVSLHINSLGCSACRPAFKNALTTFLAGRSGDLCSDCLRRRDRNPLRVFDCKVPTCKESMVYAPSILDYLCEACQVHFDTIRRALDTFSIRYETDHRLVRGLDYYTRTTFEVLAGALGAQDAVAGGGRYDGLVKTLGGPDQPGVGFGIGADRLIELLEGRGKVFTTTPRLFVAALGQEAQEKAFYWVQELRAKKVRTEMDFQDRSLKAQMRKANKLGAAFVLIVGDRELENKVAVFRNLETKAQEEVSLENLVTVVSDRIGAQ
jgi:histidyl-tRNA synthetase